MATAAIDDGAALQTSKGTIADSAATCISAFNEFLTVNSLPIDVDDVESSTWAEEQMARFSIWAANLGVFARGHASADYRLRDSDEICSLILQLLDALRENFVCAVTSSAVQAEEEAPNSKSDSDTSEGHSPALSTSSFTFSSMSSNKASAGDALPPSVLEARTEVEDAISRLNRLSASIRNSAAQFRDAKADTFVDEDDQGNNWTDFYAHLSILVIKQKFPDAREELQKRLAGSLARRRNQLAYRRRHQRKLTRRYTDGRPLLGAFHQHRSRPIEATVSRPQQEEKIPIQLEVKQQVLSNTSASLFDPKRFANRPKSTTSKAPSTVMLGTPSQVATLNFPAEPKLDQSGFFECPYCFIICPAKEARGAYWKHHVMKDLAPYVCLFDDCKNPLENFQTFSDWVTHIQNEHAPLHWDCLAPVHEPESFDDQDLYMEHMKSFHSGKFASSQLPALAQMSARAESRLFTICPFCNHLPEELTERNSGLEVQENQSALQKHIAQHLQSLGLISLAWLNNSKSDASSKRDSDLAIEDDAESLNFDDLPGKQAKPTSGLDPDWKGAAPVTNDIGVDQAWESTRTSEEAAMEWWFVIDPSEDLNPDHTQDETLAPFVAAFLRSTAAGSTFLSEMVNSLYPIHSEDFLELYRVQCDRLESITIYSSLLPWKKYDDDNSYHLRGTQIYTGPISGEFVVYHDYICPCIPNKVSPFSLSIPTPKDTIKILSQELCSASSLLNNGTGKHLSFYLGEEILSPYLVIYSNRTYIESRFKVLDYTARRLLEGFLSYIYSSVGPIYEEADRHFAAGLTNSKLIPFLFSAEGIVITTSHGSTDILAFFHEFTVPTFAVTKEPTWMVCMRGVSFSKTISEEPPTRGSDVDVQIGGPRITVEISTNEGLVRIQDLKVYPLKFASVEVVKYLRERGDKWKDFWTSNEHRYVAYTQPDQLGTNSNVMMRFIIDMQAYWTTHPQTEPDSDGVELSGSSQEGENLLLLLPHEIVGFSLESMSWINLRIDYIKEIEWHPEHLDHLIIDGSFKVAIMALVRERLLRDRLSLDNRRANNRGLVMLFHGPPGTGKSTTVKCIAEYVQRPLYRVSGQVLMSNPKTFEKNVVEIFERAKRWNCVVLLEEASDILQVRRNPLAFTFLQEAKLFDGFLIITNAVESIDPLWKSRIHLSLSFQEFSISQRKQVWLTLINRAHLNQSKMDLEEHELYKLAAFRLNATEIQGILKNAQEASPFDDKITFDSLLSCCTESEGVSLEKSAPTSLLSIVSSKEDANPIHILNIQDEPTMPEEDKMKETSTDELTYKETAVLMISWGDGSDDMITTNEVSNLGIVFRNSFDFKVIHREIEKGRRPQFQIQKYLADFVHEYDHKSTLLIVYYAGHGIRIEPEQLEQHVLPEKPRPNEAIQQRNSIIWHEARPILKRTEGDVLVIFDSCYSGNLAENSTLDLHSTRAFEFLAASRPGNITSMPGPHSFTTALITSLQDLLKQRKSFTVFELAYKIRRCNKYQDPVLYEMTGSYKRQIVLAASTSILESSRGTMS